MISKHDLSSKHSLAEMVDVIEDEEAGFAEEPNEEFYACSSSHWDSLTPAEQAHLERRYTGVLVALDLPEE